MEENVRHAVIRYDEPEALGDIEPLDAAADLDQLKGALRRNVLDRIAAAVEGLNLALPVISAGTKIVRHEETQSRITPRDS
jgi:hypothetical protein